MWYNTVCLHAHSAKLESYSSYQDTQVQQEVDASNTVHHGETTLGKHAYSLNTQYLLQFQQQPPRAFGLSLHWCTTAKELRLLPTRQERLISTSSVMLQRNEQITIYL